MPPASVLFVLLALPVGFGRAYQLPRPTKGTAWPFREDEKTRIAVVTGANRGLGFAAVKRLCQVFTGRIFLTARSIMRGMDAVMRLNRIGCFPSFRQLDIVNRRSREEFAKYLRTNYGGLDLLINNAAVRQRDEKVSFELRAKANLRVNFYGTLFTCQELFPQLRRHARVVHVSSPCGHPSDLPSPALRERFMVKSYATKKLLNAVDSYKDSLDEGNHLEMGWGNDSYCVSKVAVSALAALHQRLFDAVRRGADILVNSYSPGAVRTNVTGFRVDAACWERAVNVVRLATLPKNTESPAGAFVWHDLTVVGWNGTKPDYVD